MPELSRFFGIVIAMYYNDHAPPHFHAKYGENEATVRIGDGEILDGFLSARAKRSGLSRSGESFVKKSLWRTGCGLVRASH